jgi:lipoyl-dependent peroxiredoxin
MTDVIDTRKEKLIYTARTHTTGGREGESRSDDGRLQVKLDRPGTPGKGTNPEQLFAAGWSACFEGAMGVAARKRRIALPPETSLDAAVDLYSGDGVYTLAARLTIHIPGMERETAQAIVDDAHEICPYSSATRGNIDVEIRLI